MTLQKFIQTEMGKPFRLGTNDCAHFIARWVQMNTGKDPLMPFNGLPADMADSLIKAGKLTSSVARGCRFIGLKRTPSPKPGDIGVIRRPSAIQCALLGKTGWIFFSESGMGLMKNAPIIAAWRVKCLHQ